MTSPKPGRQQAKRLATRAKLLDATVRALKEVGYREFTLADVARFAEVSKGAIQHHFESKQALVHAVVTERFQTAQVPMAIPDHIRDASIHDRSEWLIDWAWGVFSSEQFMTVWDLVFASRRSDPELSQNILDWRESGFDEAGLLVKTLFPECKFTKRNSREMVNFLIAHLRGLSFTQLSESHTDPQHQIKLLKSMFSARLREEAR